MIYLLTELCKSFYLKNIEILLILLILDINGKFLLEIANSKCTYLRFVPHESK